MLRSEPGTITRALNTKNVSPQSRAVFDTVYAELRLLARAQLANEYGDRTIQPTVLVHEAYMKLIGKHDVTWESRAHFFGAAAKAMQQILVDEARKRGARKRNGGKRCIPLREDGVAARRGAASHSPMNWIGLAQALEEIEKQDEELALVVQLRFFAGLDNGAIARALNVSTRKVERDWGLARAWLRRRMGEDERLEG